MLLFGFLWDKCQNYCSLILVTCHFSETGRQPNLAGCREKVGSCLVSSDGYLDCQAVWHVDARQRVSGAADAVPHAALGGRHGVDTGQYIQPLWEMKRGQEEKRVSSSRGRREQSEKEGGKQREEWIKEQ